MTRAVDSTLSRRLIPREGLYISPLFAILRKLFLNPLLSAPVAFVLHSPLPDVSALSNLSLSFFTSLLQTTTTATLLDSLKSLLVTSPSTEAHIAKILVALGCVYQVNRHLSFWARNNWVKDTGYDWSREIVLVTGGATKTGFGGLVTQDLMRRGIRVVVLDIEKLEYQTNALVKYYKCDLSNAEEIKTVADRVKKEVGDPTIIVNNAGLSRGKPLTAGTHHDVHLTFSVNTLSQFSILCEFLLSMIRRNHGHIVTISSASALVPPPEILDYGASKAALVNLHEGLQFALVGAPKIRTTLLVPSFAKTPIFKGETNQSWFLLPLLHPETVSDVIVNQILSGYGKDWYIPGFMGVVPYMKLLPVWLSKILLSGGTKTKVDFEGRQKMDAMGRQVAGA